MRHHGWCSTRVPGSCAGGSPLLQHAANHTSAPPHDCSCAAHAGIGRLPDAYLQPTLGRVQLPGSSEMVDVPAAAHDDMEPHYYMT